MFGTKSQKKSFFLTPSLKNHSAETWRLGCLFLDYSQPGYLSLQMTLALECLVTLRTFFLNLDRFWIVLYHVSFQFWRMCCYEITLSAIQGMLMLKLSWLKPPNVTFLGFHNIDLNSVSCLNVLFQKFCTFNVLSQILHWISHLFLSMCSFKWCFLVKTTGQFLHLNSPNSPHFSLWLVLLL